MAAGPISERNQDATIYVGGLDEKVTESLLWELFVQVIQGFILRDVRMSNVSSPGWTSCQCPHAQGPGHHAASGIWLRGVPERG